MSSELSGRLPDVHPQAVLHRSQHFTLVFFAVDLPSYISEDLPNRLSFELTSSPYSLSRGCWSDIFLVLCIVISLGMLFIYPSRFDLDMSQLKLLGLHRLLRTVFLLRPAGLG
jgi:hypothetical protein